MVVPSEISRFFLGRSSRSLYAGYKSRDAHPRFSGIIISRCVFVHLEMKTHLGTPSRDFKTHVMQHTLAAFCRRIGFNQSAFTSDWHVPAPKARTNPPGKEKIRAKKTSKAERGKQGRIHEQGLLLDDSTGKAEKLAD